MGSWRDRPSSFQEALRVAREILSASAELVVKGSIPAESELLVTAAYCKATHKSLSRLDLYSRAADRFPEEAADLLLILAATRAEGKPLQHLTGTQVFLEHEYEVGPDVLVPRPETEVLVVTALQELRTRAAPPVLGIEIGIGSGAISVELLSEFSSLRMLASELTEVAEARALSNASRILGAGAARLRVLRSLSPLHVWEAFDPSMQGLKADFIISNPPYLASTDPIEQEVISHEPHTALFAPEKDLIHFYREVALKGREYLKPEGQVFMELPPERAREICEAFTSFGWRAVVHHDLAGRDRVLVATLAPTG